MFGKRLRELRDSQNLSMDKLIELYNKKYDAKMNKSTLSRYENGIQDPIYTVVVNLADFFGVSVDFIAGSSPISKSAISVTDDYITFPIIGEIAAGYDNIAIENWEGDTIDIPLSHLSGRPPEDYFVLCVKGDSMFPTYHENDKVLILKQTTMDYSGQVGAILYDSEYTTLKKIEYKKGEDWVKLVPINANYPVIKIENEDLETCKVLGIPKLLIREIND